MRVAQCNFYREADHCNDVEVPSDQYDVFLLIGQSNTFAGQGFDSIIDAPHKRIKQLGRHSSNNLQIIPAQDPLEHTVIDSGKIGFAMTFAKLYSCSLLTAGRNVIIIPNGQGGTGFENNRWNKGDDLYEDAVFRTNYILDSLPEASLKAILWHQGEFDVSSPMYEESLDSMIINLRNDINRASEVVFILGGMVPYWVDQSGARINQECIIKSTPNRLDNVLFVDPRTPCGIAKPENNYDAIHFDARGQRELGARYFEAFLESQ